MSLNSEALKFDQGVHDFANFVLNRTTYNQNLAMEQMASLDLPDDLKQGMSHILKAYESRQFHTSALMKMIGDTSPTTRISAYMDVMRDIGFEQVFSEHFQNEAGGRDQLSAYHEKETGILIVVETDSHSDLIDSAHLYANWTPAPGVNPQQMFHHGQGHSDGIYSIHSSVISGLKNTIEGLVAYGKLEPQWKHQPSLTMTTRMERGREDTAEELALGASESTRSHLQYLYERSHARIAELPTDVKVAIGIASSPSMKEALEAYGQISSTRQEKLSTEHSASPCKSPSGLRQ